MSKEKIYKFTRATSPSTAESYTLKESELTQSDKDMLLGEAIRSFDELTSELKLRFFMEIKK